MAEEQDLKVVITSDTSQAEQGVNNFGQSLGGLNALAVATGEIIADLAEKIIQMGIDTATAAIKMGENLQFMRMNLDNLTGSSQKTAIILGQLKDLSEKGIFNDVQLEQYTQRLIQMGIPQEKINSLIHDMANVAVGTSTSLEDASGKMQTLANLFGYLDDNGEISVTMLGKFSKTLGIPLLDTVAKQMGLTTIELANMGAKAKITEADLQKAFDTMGSGNGKFAKSVAIDSQSMEARNKALKTTFDELALSILGVSKDGQVIKGGFYDLLSTATGTLINWIKQHAFAVTGLGTTIHTVYMNQIKPLLDTAQQWWKQHGDFIMSLLNSLGAFIQAFWDFIKMLFDQYLSGIVNWVKDNWNIIAVTTIFIFTLIGNIIKGALDLITGLLKVFTDIFSGNWKKLWTDVKSTVSNIINDIRGILEAFFNWITGLINSVLNNIAKIGSSAGSIGKKQSGGLASGLTLVGEAGPELVELPSGSYVNNATSTQNILNKSNGITIEINNPTVRNDNDITNLVNQIKKVLGRENELARLGAI